MADQIKHKRIHVSMVDNMYYRLLPQQMSSSLVLMLNSIIDSLFTSHYMGAEGMAAIGFYGPLSNIIYLCYVLVVGAQVLCCNSIGRGNEKETASLFSTCAAVVAIYAGICSTVMMFFPTQLAGLLGASGHVAVLLAEYIRTVSFGMIALVLYSLFMTFLDLNSRRDLSWISITVMLVSNTVMDLIFIKYLNMGIAGLGLATSISCIMAMLVSITGVIKSKRRPAVYLQRNNFCFNRIFEMGKLGSTEFAFNLSAGFKAYVMNILLMNTGGTDAVAAAAVLNTVCCFVGMIPNGTSTTTRTLGSIFFGEKNRPAMEELLNTSLRTAMIMSVSVIAVIQIFAPQFAGLFYTQGSQVYFMTVRMLRIFIWWAGFTAAINNIISIRQAQKQVFIANVTSICENLYIALFAFLLSHAIGIDGIWLAYPVAEIVDLIIIFFYIVHTLKHFPRHSGEWAGLGAEFSASMDDSISVEVRNTADVVNVSENVRQFLKKHGFNEKTCYYAALAVEEMAGNIVEHGFKDNHKHAIDVYLAINSESCTVRIRDNCRMFDPLQYMQQFTEDDPQKNVGIKLAAKTAKQMKYQRLIGFNYLTVDF